jgi:hypothetical protein
MEEFIQELTEIILNIREEITAEQAKEAREALLEDVALLMEL